MNLKSLIVVIWAFSNLSILAQTNDSTYRKNFVSGSMFMIANALPVVDPPNYYMLNYGRRLSSKDVLIIEAITWQYSAPIGIPYGPSYEDPNENYPGKIRDFGIGLAYQRFWYKGLYTTLHATPFLHQYFNEDGEHIQNGFQLFTTSRLGYHFELFKNRFFVEPSLAITYWPVSTNTPAEFQKQDDMWPNYFLFEPGLNIGYLF